MSETVISVENLGKKYRIRHQQRERYTALRDVIANKFAAPFRWLSSGGSKNGAGGLHPNSQLQPPISQLPSPISSSSKLLTSDLRPLTSVSAPPAQEDFWALKDVSFEVKQGDVLGIIGRNGAGKSTLLKILSRITEPTRGRVRIKGRVASLLEVGTGFHPELTGRENTFLNGAILGMTREEIKRKFDEIVSFAEIEKFLDTPVKRYSSGMYVRLAFAVAANLEPEILFVDEVLAVGDSAFQKKCLGKMNDIARSGRTILFVSHNIGSIRALCNKVVWLDSGRIEACGQCERVVNGYLHSIDESSFTEQIPPEKHREGSGKTKIESISFVDGGNTRKRNFLIGEPFTIRLTYRVLSSVEGTFWLFISSLDGTKIFSSFQKDVSEPVLLAADGTVSVCLDRMSLLPGTYTVSAGVFGKASEVVDWVDNAGRFDILPHFEDGRPFDHRYGLLTHELSWEIEELTFNESK